MSDVSLEQAVAQQLRQMASEPQIATVQGLEAALRFLAKWRSRLIDQAVVARSGAVVQGGPFAGMAFVAEPSECSLSPKLLGGYEAELHGLMAEIVASDLDCIVDIGCADGYYAVGFARLMPRVEVLAYDINPAAQRHCTDLAARNGVSDRVKVAGEFAGEAFGTFAGRKALVFMDIEGAEDELLRPDLYPGLRDLKILVECHDVFRPGLSQRIADRFAGTHHLRRFESTPQNTTLPDYFNRLSHLDQLLAGWEWRAGPTPWLFLTPHHFA